MQRPIRFLCVGVCIATGLNYTYITAKQIYTEFRSATDNPTVRVTTTKVPGSVRTEISEQDGDAWFENGRNNYPDYRLPSFSSVNPGKYRDNTSIWPQPLPSEF
jgi:hypothetical protein